MYAVVETGSKQYKVSKGDILKVELVGAKDGKECRLNKVLLVSDKKEVSIGKPYVKGASVACKVLGEERGEKTISLKYRRRHASSRRKIGHRQDYTVLKVEDIIT